MNIRMMGGGLAILLGVLVLLWPQFLSVIVGLGLIAFGLWIAFQAGGGNTRL